jgi:hypothetical protein
VEFGRHAIERLRDRIPECWLQPFVQCDFASLGNLRQLLLQRAVVVEQHRCAEQHRIGDDPAAERPADARLRHRIGALVEVVDDDLEIERSAGLRLDAEREQLLPRQLRFVGRDALFPVVAHDEARIVEHARSAAIAIPAHHFVRRLLGQPELTVVCATCVRPHCARVAQRIDAEQDAVRDRRLQQRDRLGIERAMPFVLHGRREPKMVAVPHEEGGGRTVRARAPRAAAGARQLAQILHVDAGQLRPIDERSVDLDCAACAPTCERDRQRHRLPFFRRVDERVLRSCGRSLRGRRHEQCSERYEQQRSVHVAKILRRDP